MSGERKSKIPDVPTPAAVPGNLLSSVAPPADLPSFITSAISPNPQESQATPQPVLSAPLPAPVPIMPDSPEKFSPVIPLSKGVPTLPIRSPDESHTSTQSPISLPDSNPDTERLGDPMPGSGLITWMKGAVSSGGLLARVAEKAKSSVDSMITTLDPQMKEYLNSGGDMFVVVASDKEVKVTPVRDAFQNVFGKATVIGYPAQSEVTAVQPVGYASAYAAAKERIAQIRATHSDITNNTPIVAVENYIYEAVQDKWYDISLVILCQPSLGIELQLQSQGTPIPAAAIAAMQASTPDNYEHIESGLNTPVGSVMGTNLQVHNTQWQEAATGVSRRDIIHLAAKSIAGSYKKLLDISAAGV